MFSRCRIYPAHYGFPFPFPNPLSNSLCLSNIIHSSLAFSTIFFILLIFLCRNLKLEYIDLYLIHWPVSSKPGLCECPIKKEDFLPMDYKSVWSAMEECQRLGLTKAIGVSNFSCKKLADVLATIPPAVNQVRFFKTPKTAFLCTEKPNAQE